MGDKIKTIVVDPNKEIQIVHPKKWITKKKKKDWITYDPKKQQDPKELIKLKKPEEYESKEWITKKTERRPHKSGGCVRLAKKGGGRAYGKNS
jgi:hypothetical protein